MGELTNTILSEVADREGVDPVELEPPLHDAIDTEALDALFGTPKYDVTRLVFTYAGYEVVVEGTQDVRVEPT